MKKTLQLLFALALLLEGPALLAQGLAPFRAEYHKQAKGLLTLINDKDVAVRVKLKAQSFTSDADGRLQLLPLDPNLNLILSQTSMRVPAKETRYVSYESKPKSAPAWFVIYATFTPELPGIVVGTSVPHFAFITDIGPKREELELTASFDASSHMLRISFVNHGKQIAHVEQMEASGGAMKKELGSLSILPEKSTHVETVLDASAVPSVVKADLGKFKLQCQVSAQ